IGAPNIASLGTPGWAGGAGGAGWAGWPAAGGGAAGFCVDGVLGVGNGCGVCAETLDAISTTAIANAPRKYGITQLL
ncbi:MAG: hypothetical protein Q8L75_10180, partial [Acidobacteriota bacterium]|nr:hypothetical protein [Acidobacteriota bacterium]